MCVHASDRDGDRDEKTVCSFDCVVTGSFAVWMPPQCEQSVFVTITVFSYNRENVRVRERVCVSVCASLCQRWGSREKKKKRAGK